MEPEEAQRFQAISRGQKNSIVKQLIEETNDEYECEDQLGTDGNVYTAFRKAKLALDAKETNEWCKARLLRLTNTWTKLISAEKP